MENNNRNYKIFKFLGIAVVLFYAFIFIGSRFVTVGVDSKPEEPQTEYTSEYLKQEAELKDATIIGKFWNNKGHFIVVYDEDTKAPKIVSVAFSEWQLMDIGELQ